MIAILILFFFLLLSLDCLILKRRVPFIIPGEGGHMQYYEINFFVFNQDSLTVIGDQGLREILADIVYMIPKDTVDDALSNCVFLMLGEKRGVQAAYIHEKLIKGKSICAFYEMLYCKDRDDQIDMVLHEIAHHVLGHIDEGFSEEEYFNKMLRIGYKDSDIRNYLTEANLEGDTSKRKYLPLKTYTRWFLNNIITEGIFRAITKDMGIALSDIELSVQEVLLKKHGEAEI